MRKNRRYLIFPRLPSELDESQLFHRSSYCTSHVKSIESRATTVRCAMRPLTFLAIHDLEVQTIEHLIEFIVDLASRGLRKPPEFLF
jgi:hypothetical protein